jgi:DNA helicase-2/ATP-dependent DNA helicase PcrA
MPGYLVDSPLSPPPDCSDAAGGRDAFLSPLNPHQRDAVEHGTGRQGPVAGPLLVIAGAGSGKTNTLAYRVAHLVLKGADPHRVLLLTFSRRAAAEMERRAGQHLHRALGAATRQGPGALQWAGTFHSVGARLLREYARASACRSRSRLSTAAMPRT